ncbi:DUF6438 domain-containing protein [Arcticibacter tournemirensis]|uniref:DUF6438 domain-containing protein n=1 Tax=Arcticibacter tournemirensis TaxID=699437 RepID=A0A4Q0MGB5_9SPHI|nr:DUF6438 domain-containing protein [Arcticibacter tournemirensis]RXF72385.1 hypothetical protein EKH83_01260 [Arcticibacter tournemirensis]
MKKKVYFPVLILILQIFISCIDQSPSKYQSLLIGEWKQVVEPPKPLKNGSGGVVLEPPAGKVLLGYRFFAGNKCESRTGFYRLNPNSRKYGAGRLFLGNRTQYKIEEDSLKIYDPGDRTWYGWKIEGITADTLRLRSNTNLQIRYAKANYESNKRLLYDQIIVSTSGCYGTCPINNTLITSRGDVLYYGEEYNTKEGPQKSKITLSRFKEIEQAFFKANLPSLNEDYFSEWTDDETISVSFIRNGRIIKTVEDYGRAAPTELYWAYTPLRYLYQSLDLDTINNLPLGLNIKVEGFTYGEKICVLKKSEQFYLWSILKNAKITNRPFQKEYKLVFSGQDQLVTVETDGRFYRFILKDGHQKTYDIGFNFITRNPEIIHFREKTVYETSPNTTDFSPPKY